MTMLVDQAQGLRELAAKATPQEAPRRAESTARSRVMAIASGKGGVGKSNVCVNLAVRLASIGRKIIVLDADLGTANADVLCDLQPAGTLAHVVAGRRTLSDIILDAPGGFRLVPGVSGLAAMASLEDAQRTNLVTQMHALEHAADLILIDTGAGISPNILSFTACADELLVVTTPEPTAITDAYALMKAAHRQRHDVEMRLLVNMVRDRAEALRVFDRVDRVCRRFLGVSPRFAGHVVWDERVAQAVRRRRPFVLDAPGCPAARCIEALASRVDRSAQLPAGAGLMQRLTGWLRPVGGGKAV